MDWSTSALMNNSPLARRLPGQRTPPDPTLEQPNAADLTYGWHASDHDSGSGSHSQSESESESDGEGHVGRAEGSTRQQEAAAAFRQRRRERRANRRAASLDSSSSSEGSIVSFDSATAEQPNVVEGVGAHDKSSKPENQQDPSAANDGPHASNHDSESFICRICFDGSGSQDEGGETLGRLIAPCRCRGTMKFVHQACLTRWRATSMRASSFMACDQCGSPYKFRKSKFVGLATNRVLILAVSCLLFTTLIWSVGFTAEMIVQRWDDAEQPSSRKGATSAQHKGGYLHSLFGDEDDGVSDSLYDDGGDVYTYGYGYVSTFYWEPLSYFRLIKAAVKHVGSGRATRAVKQLVKGEPDRADLLEEKEGEMGWFQSLLDDWKYGPGGLWHGQRPEREKEGGGVLDKEQQSAADRSERYDAQTATVLKAGEKPRRASKSTSKPSQDPSSASEAGRGRGWWDRLTMQFSLGFSLVGIFSFLNLLLGVSLWGPFQLGNFGLGHSFARLTGGGRRRGGGGGGGGGDGGTIASVVLLFLVIIGILRALMAVISLTTYLSKRLLTRVEDYIVEYSGEEVDQGRGAAAAAMPAAAVNVPVLQRNWWWRRN